MKIGVIIIFHNNQEDIDKDLFTHHFNASDNLKFCLVNNQSTDDTVELLKDIREACKVDLAIVDIKKKVSKDAAKRAGARYLINTNNLRHFGFIEIDMLFDKRFKFGDLIKEIDQNSASIAEFNSKKLKKQGHNPALIKRVFSVVDYLKTLNAGRQDQNFNHIVKT